MRPAPSKRPSISVVKSTNFVEGEGPSDSLVPQSLYEDQLAGCLSRC